MSSYPLMPKATAAWLIDNTALTFEQIAEFCGLHALEIQALADGEVNTGIVGSSPLQSGELTAEEIARCEGNTRAKLKMHKTNLPKPRSRAKGPRYTPVNKRAEKPNAILWLIKEYPDLLDAQIARLIGSTKTTVESIRNRTHLNMNNLKPTEPVSIGLCTADELDKAIKKAERRRTRDGAAPADEGDDQTEAFDTSASHTAEDNADAQNGGNNNAEYA